MMNAQVVLVMEILRDIHLESIYLVHNMVLRKVLLLEAQLVLYMAILSSLHW